MTTTPLCVDLDGTLCRSDTLIEALLILLKEHPFRLFAAFGALLKGKARFKQRIAALVTLPLDTLPWRLDFVDWLRQQHLQGRRLILCTGADESVAAAVGAHFGFFDGAIASNGTDNLTGTQKRDALVREFGAHGFDYAGNERKDAVVWAAASQAVVAESTPALLREAARAPEGIAAKFPNIGRTGPAWIKALRLHQWVKNTLVLLPLLLAHRFGALLVAQTLGAFIAFSLCASSVYLLNDLLDLDSDRRHPRKCRRAFAAGRLPLAHGLIAAPMLLGAAFGLAALIGPGFLLVLGAYYGLTLAYSFRLKRLEIVDVMTLAALYTVRVVAGGRATGLPLSFWLLAFAMFFFLSLGVVKRYAEMLMAKSSTGLSIRGRGYHVEDLPLLGNLGVSAGYASALVLALYVNSPESQALYHHPHVLWLLCPLQLFWLSRLWMKTYRGEMHDDPVIFALSDPMSQLIALIAGAIMLSAALLP